MQSSAPTDAVEQIREFADSVDNPRKWMIAVPESEYGQVKAELDTVYDTGTYYQGIALCYTTNHDSVQIEYKSSLEHHLSETAGSE